MTLRDRPLPQPERYQHPEVLHLGCGAVHPETMAYHMCKMPCFQIHRHMVPEGSVIEHAHVDLPIKPQEDDAE